MGGIPYDLLEIKSEFLTRYLNHNIYFNDIDTQSVLINNMVNYKMLVKYGFLKLKRIEKNCDNIKLDWEKNFVSCDDEKIYFSIGSSNYNYEEITYLRSKGYALPWMGLSVEQQIEYGWIKLIEE